MTNKCATLRHGGRYGGSLGGQNKGSPSPNLKNTQPPSISTVSNEYQTRGPYNATTLQFNKKERDNNDGGGGGNKPQSTVYSIDTSTPHVNFSKQNTKPNEMSNTGGPIKGISILNQPLPEIPQQQTQTLKVSDLNKNLQQPLSVSNLNQYRSLQRPSSKLSTSQMNSYQHHQQQQQQQQQHYQQQQPLHSNKPSIQLPPKVNPPSLPPKNRQKDDLQQQPLPNRNSRQLQTGTLPSSRSQHLNQISNFNRENGGVGSVGGNNSNKSGAGSTTYSTFGYEKGQNINQMTTFDKPMTKNNGGFSYTDQGNTKQLNITKQGYQTLPHQHRNHHNNSNNQQQSQMQQPQHQQHQGYSQQQNNTTSFHNGKSSKNINKLHQQQQQQQDDIGMMGGGGVSGNKKDDPNLYYRSLQRGGSQANNDLYSVTEL